jgi:hypothetical protein
MNKSHITIKDLTPRIFNYIYDGTVNIDRIVPTNVSTCLYLIPVCFPLTIASIAAQDSQSQSATLTSNKTHISPSPFSKSHHHPQDYPGGAHSYTISPQKSRDTNLHAAAQSTEQPLVTTNLDSVNLDRPASVPVSVRFAAPVSRPSV